MSWTFAPEFDAASSAALDAGKPVMYLAPPAAWAVRPLLDRLPAFSGVGLGTLVLVPERLQASEIQIEAAAVPALSPVRLAAGLERTGRLVKAGRARTLVATAPTAYGLLALSALDLSSLERIVICWPELHASLDNAADLDALLREARSAQRIVVTGHDSAAGDFVTRYAHRAPAVMAATVPETPLAPVQFAIVAGTALERAVDRVLDRLAPDSVFIWDPSVTGPHRWLAYAGQAAYRCGVAIDGPATQLAVATDLPSAAALAALQQVARDVVVLARPSQLAYLRALVREATPLAVSDEVDRARDWREELRRTVRRRIASETCEASLLALAPLFDEFDPALVAAALVEPAGTRPQDTATTPDVPLWAHLHLNIGRRDNVRPGDIVGALLNAVGIPKEHVGRVDLRDTYSLLEIRAESAEAARRGLAGVAVRGRSVSARFDRK